MKPSRLASLAVIVLFAAWAPPSRSAEPALRIHVASRSFAVTVSPSDAESRNAENAVLYQRRDVGEEWKSIGMCRKQTMPDGEVRFTRDVEVDEDGLYYYTSRPVVGGNVERPPGADAPTQAVVVADTLPPAAEILLPEEDAVLTVGRAAPLAWKATDENLAERPVALMYSPDAGRSWLQIAAGLPGEGRLPWTPPADLAGPVVFRMTAADKAGNVGRAVRRAVAEEPLPPAEPEREPPPAAAKTHPAEILEQPPKTDGTVCDSNRSWLYYLMAVNLMRQNKPKDALQYYWLAVREDPNFVDAWADIGLAYIDLGAYKTAREVVERARNIAPGRIDLMHLLGETHHAEAMDLLGRAKTPEERGRARDGVDQAVEWYGRAIEAAADEWRLAERAASYYRLGEICYYVNMDRDGARAYWRKILDLHSPTPNYDLVLWTEPDRREEAKDRYRRHTHQRSTLETWQKWARGYLEQLDSRERAGILDLMPAQKLGARARQGAGGGILSGVEGADDESRSLFSLPSQYGSSPVPPAGAGESSGSAPARRMAADEYSFYAEKPDAGLGRREAAANVSPPARRGGSIFSGGPDRPPPPDPDPYAFPQRGRKRPAWNGIGPYGDQPARDW